MIYRLLNRITKNAVLALFAFLAIVIIFSLSKSEPAEITQPSPEDVKGTQSEQVQIGGYIKLQEIHFKVYPEKRQPQPSHINNWSTIAEIVIRDSATSNIVLSDTVTTNNFGEGTLTLSPTENVPAGNYNIFIKGYSHLTKEYPNIYLSKIVENIDFTPYGDLLAGDTYTDDQVNSLDVSTLLSQLNSNNYKNDLNQDALVNSLDISIQVYNMGKVGDA